jgi:hypothetical protein
MHNMLQLVVGHLLQPTTLTTSMVDVLCRIFAC